MNIQNVTVYFFTRHCMMRGNVIAAISWNYVSKQGKFSWLDRNYMQVASTVASIVSGGAGNTLGFVE